MKYNTGDRVRIVNYGHKISVHPEMLHYMPKCPVIGKDQSGGYVIDIDPRLIGREGIIEKEFMGEYSIKGIGAWYNPDQLELIQANNVLASTAPHLS